MGRFFWILIGALGLLLIVLIGSDTAGTQNQTLGMETGQFAVAGVMAIWAILIGSAAFGQGLPFGDTIKQAAIWLIIIVVLMAGYIFRFDLQDVASRFTGGLVPGSPISIASNDGGLEVTLIRSDNDHFEAEAEINGKSIRFLVDTGASAIVLSAKDADTAGIDPDTLSYNVLTQTANGIGRSARAKISEIDLGGIVRRNLTVLVAEPGRLNQSLLGQQFLESLSSYEKRGDRLTLRD